MPTCAGEHPGQAQRWIACMRIAGDRMVAEGWSRHARKFGAVRIRRARQLLRRG